MYERTSQFERGERDGLIQGVLATDGEASDGHIINIRGMEIPEHVPLLVNHDERETVGSWLDFNTGDHELRGRAQIEMGGDGGKLADRRDLWHMIDAGHIGSFSVRWDPVGEPVRRTDLPKGHPAHVPPSSKGRERFGMYFEKSRVLEGSVVTLGADPGALIGRMRNAEPAAREFWARRIDDYLAEDRPDDPMIEALRMLRDAVNLLRGQGIEDLGTLLRLCRDEQDPSGLIPVSYGDGKRVLIHPEAHATLMGEANARLRTAFDLLATTAGGDDAHELEPDVPAEPATPEPTAAYDAEPPARDALADLEDLEAAATRARQHVREWMSARGVTTP